MVGGWVSERDACTDPFTSDELYVSTKLVFKQVIMLLLLQVLVHKNIHHLRAKKKPVTHFLYD